MTILEIILLVIVVALAMALFFQMKAAKRQSEDGQQLLNDYQRRVDELQRLLEDYNSLSKNFENIGLRAGIAALRQDGRYPSSSGADSQERQGSRQCSAS